MNSRPQASPGDDPGDSKESSSDDAGTTLQRAQRLLATLQPQQPTLALLSTVAPTGHPHATWMFASLSKAPGLEIITITSPDSDKVRNIRSHSNVEWLLTSSDRLQQLYLEGEACVVEDVAEIRELWNAIEDKGRLYFINYYNSGLGFSIIRSTINAAIFIAPEEHQKTRFNIEELIA